MQSHLSSSIAEKLPKSGQPKSPEVKATQKSLGDVEELIRAMENTGATDLVEFSHRLKDVRAATLRTTSPLLVPVVGHEVAVYARSRITWTFAPLAAVIGFLGFCLWSVWERVEPQVKNVEITAKDVNGLAEQVKSQVTDVNEKAKAVTALRTGSCNRLTDCQRHLVDQTSVSFRNTFISSGTAANAFFPLHPADLLTNPA